MAATPEDFRELYTDEDRLRVTDAADSRAWVLLADAASGALRLPVSDETYAAMVRIELAARAAAETPLRPDRRRPQE